MKILKRRIGRLGFALGFLPLFTILLAVIVKSGQAHWHPAAGDVKGYLLLAAYFIWVMCISAWRCHDYGKSAWSNFWTEQTPLIGPFLGLWDLLSKPGDTGRNRYGSPPWI